MKIPPQHSFAQRVQWSTTPNPLTQEVKRYIKQDISFLDLTCSNPTQCGFDYPLDWFSQRNLDASRFYQAESQGLLAARNAVMRYYESRSENITPENLILTSSSSEAYSYLFRLLCNPGDTVFIPRPSYPLFQYLTQLNDLEYQSYSLVFEKNRWVIDFDELKQFIHPRIKALLLVNPNNPTGSVIAPDQYEDLIAFCAQHQIAIICDEVFIDYPLQQDLLTPSMVEESRALTFVINGLSKTLALPQMKCSWIHVSGPDALKQESLSKLDIIADTYLSVNTPVQHEMPLWLASRERIQKPIIERCRDNYAYLKEKCTSRVFPCQAGWSAIIAIDDDDEEKWCIELLKKQKVLTHPGYLFDFEEKIRACVVSLLTNKDVFHEGVQCLLKY